MATTNTDRTEPVVSTPATEQGAREIRSDANPNIEIISQRKTQVGPVAVTFTVGRIKARNTAA